MSHGIQHDRSQGLIDFAYEFAKEAHGDQKRKYSGEPYINHPVEVAQRVAAVTLDCEAIAAALLHDVIEDTDVTFEDICNAGFGIGIAQLVNEVTDVSQREDGNRAVRKQKDLEHLAEASARGQTIKLADLISNAKDIMVQDPRFAKVYMKENRDLLKVLTKGDKTLYAEALESVDNYFGGGSEVSFSAI